jgi:tripartite-type tricarboxylate transporter receptor subunit TctC
MRLLCAGAALAAVLLQPVQSHAADAAYPTHPITLILSYPPGGGTDLVARLLARELDRTLGQSVVVENHPGGAGIIGTNIVMRANPDGYTLFLADPAYATTPALMKNVPYDLKKDLVPISTVTLSPLVLAVPEGSRFKDLAQLLQAGKLGKADINFASAGLGSSPHLAAELLKLKTGTDFVHVPYKGSGPAMTDLLSGRIDFAFATFPAASQYILQGKLRGLATTGAQPSKLLPNLPTVAATVPGFDVFFWTALLAPRGTPPAVIEKLNAAVKTALQNPAMLEGLQKAGENPSYMAPEQTARFIDGENARWSQVIREGHISVD